MFLLLQLRSVPQGETIIIQHDGVDNHLLHAQKITLGGDLRKRSRKIACVFREYGIVIGISQRFTLLGEFFSVHNGLE